MGQGANMTVTNSSPFVIKMEVVRKHCIYPQTPDPKGPSGIDAFNAKLDAGGGSKSGYIENKNISSGGDFCGTDTGYFELSFTVMRDNTPDPRYTPTCTTIAIKGAHFELGDHNENGAVKVDNSFLNGDPDTISIGLKDNV
jgi:hypothetical protein